MVKTGVEFRASVCAVLTLAPHAAMLEMDVSRIEAVKKLGQAPSRPLVFKGFRRFRSEPVPFFHSLIA
jgi:hypothetical protein